MELEFLEQPGKKKKLRREKKREKKLKKEAKMAAFSFFTGPSVPDPTALPAKYDYSVLYENFIPPPQKKRKIFKRPV